MCSRYLVRSIFSRSTFCRRVYSTGVSKCWPSMRTQWLCVRGLKVSYAEHAFPRKPPQGTKIPDLESINQKGVNKNYQNTGTDSLYQSKPGITQELKDKGYVEEQEKTRDDKGAIKISPELGKALGRVNHVKGFGIADKKLVIHVPKDHEREAKKYIEEVLKRHSFNGEYFVKTSFEEHGIIVKPRTPNGDDETSGTIGCFLELKGVEDQADKRYAVTCHHVAKPDKEMDFYNCDNFRFSSQVDFHLFDKEIPADIALIPIESSCEAFQFEQIECTPSKDPSNLVDMHVQKVGAETGLTRGKIVGKRTVEINGELFHDTIVIKSLGDGLFSEKGDSGSLVTLTRDDSKETPQAVSIIFAGDTLETGEKVSYTFPFGKAINMLKQKHGIESDFRVVLLKPRGTTG